MPSKSIFISHAIKDKKIADALADLLVNTGCARHDEIFCSSLEGMGIPTGQNFVDFIRRQLASPELVIMLLSPHYFDSEFCVCELGASWVLSHEQFPLVVPPIEFSDLKAVLTGIQAGEIDSKKALNNLRDTVQGVTKAKVSSARWELKRDDFLEKIAKLLKTVGNPTKVPYEKYQELEEKYEDAKKDLKKDAEEIEEKDALIEKLKKLKDASKVRSILMEGSSEKEKFDHLVGAAKKALDKLPSCVANLIFYEHAELYFDPGDYDHDELNSACADAYITFEAGEGWKTNEEDVSVRAASRAVSNLAIFLESVSDEFIDEFEDEHSFAPKVSNRRFWREFLA